MNPQTPETPQTKTFRGRSLEELLPRVRAELGEDAIVTRQREGLMGGVGGFFQKRFVEIEATPGPAAAAAPASSPAPAPSAAGDAAGASRSARAPFIADVYAAGLEPASDAAVAEGLESPIVQAMLAQAAPFAHGREQPQAGHGTAPGASPFAAQLGAAVERAASARAAAEAAGTTPPAADGALALAAEPATPDAAGTPAGAAAAPPALTLVPAPEDDREEHREEAAAEEAAPGAPAPRDLTAPPGRAGRPPSAATLERVLGEHGVPAELAAGLVGEAVSHGLPFGTPQQLKRMVRAGLARRLATPAPRPAGGRVLAFAGPGGAGKTHAVASLARAYAEGSDLPVAVVALRPRDGGAELSALLAPAGVQPVLAASAREAAAAIDPLRERALVVLDTPAVSPAQESAVRSLGGELRRLGADEVHLLVPATTAGSAAATMVERFAALRAGALVLAHADETDHLGGVLGLAVALGRPLSYVLDAAGLAPADPAALAARVLP